MQARSARVTRGVLAAAVATFAAAFSHGIASGEAPSVVALAVASVLSVTVCVALASRSTPLRLAVAVVVSQAAFHALFAALPATTGTVTRAGHHGMISLATDAATHAHASAGLGMWLGHVAAAAVTIACLQYGERVLLGFGATLALTFRALTSATVARPVATPAASSPAWLPFAAPATTLLPFSANRRGPPIQTRTLSLV